MIEVKITPEILAEAKALAARTGHLRNSITGGDGKIAGALGEVLVKHHAGAEYAHTFDYDLIYNGLKIDVKTKRRTVIPEYRFNCSVSDFNTRQKCDYYTFVSVFDDYSRGWVLGSIKKSDFYRMATFDRKGEREEGFVFKGDCYNLLAFKLRKIFNPPDGSQRSAGSEHLPYFRELG